MPPKSPYSPRRRGKPRPPPPAQERQPTPQPEPFFIPTVVHHAPLQGARTRPRKTLPEPFPFPMGATRARGPQQQGDGADAEEPGSPAQALVHSLGSSRVRRWCLFEWMYSAVDRPWFLHSPFQDFVQHLGLAPGQELTRAEWAMLRAGMRRPGERVRRLSLAFLREERAKIKEYR